MESDLALAGVALGDQQVDPLGQLHQRLGPLGVAGVGDGVALPGHPQRQRRRTRSVHDFIGDHHQFGGLEVEPQRLAVGELVKVHGEPSLYLGGAGKQHLHRRLHPLAHPAGPATCRGRVRWVNWPSRIRNGRPPKWSPCRCDTSTSPIWLGSWCCCFRAIREEAPQSSRTSPSWPGACSRMQAWKRPPLPKASPEPTNLTWIARVVTPRRYLAQASWATTIPAGPAPTDTSTT